MIQLDTHQFVHRIGESCRFTRLFYYATLVIFWNAYCLVPDIYDFEGFLFTIYDLRIPD